MTRRIRIPVTGRLDNAGAEQRGTVVIERDTGLITVRPLGKRRTYTLPLGDVATMICERVIRNTAPAAPAKRVRRSVLAGRPGPRSLSKLFAF